MSISALILLATFFFCLYLVWRFQFIYHSDEGTIFSAVAAILVGVAFLVMICK